MAMECPTCGSECIVKVSSVTRKDRDDLARAVNIGQQFGVIEINEEGDDREIP